jgi:hypothetical protein
VSEPEGVARLRRAAEVLRERAEAANWGRWTFEPGSTVHMDSTGDFVIRSGNRTQWLARGMAKFGVGEWAATVDPSVGLALAAWLDAEAKREAHSLAEFGYRVVPNEAHELARLVLREDEGSRT